MRDLYILVSAFLVCRNLHFVTTHSPHLCNLCGSSLVTSTYSDRQSDMLILVFQVLLAHASLSISHALDSSTDHPPQQAPLRQPLCELVKGEWCQGYHKQTLQAARDPPRGNKQCPGRCSGIGTCFADTGTCACPAGWGGPDCSVPRKRPVREAD